ncbi:glucosamine-6-phosphate deaminase [Fulvivirga sp. M361]|uniref:glucosamine-6-phosphate deaminase n=1 Tax=Fulvivirga sp. M361 TaxID=2594266 RepID=UPI00117B2913|nr:glucosamine-6-phosphate deaminase [Fulvivirga sp. M361]TRX52201.1 glucosamine-6-phosphate deaminase [Fulvivirga sp. M361]
MKTLDHSQTKLEKIPVTLFDGPGPASKYVAEYIADLILRRQANGEQVVLGLATGATPVMVYQELVRMHREDGLSFQNVITFNLDEYYPIAPDSPQSYHYFMNYHLFDHVDIRRENIHIPLGTIDRNEVTTYCEEYENKIDAVGGIDIQVLGIGRTGHIGFNEPGSVFRSGTRIVKLDPVTISDATREFIKEEFVPRTALTMGIKSIFKANKVFLMAWGGKKAEIVNRAVEGEVTKEIPASFLQNHADTELVLDMAAGAGLSRFKTPWLTGFCEWTDDLRKRAVIWLSEKLDKPILKLTDKDYKQNDLDELILIPNYSQELNVKIFNDLQHTITGWPGGKPNADDTNRPERAFPDKKRVIVFSPHPDDDVISMGGTLLKLVEQEHEVHVAYQTSGNIAVFDDDAVRFAEFARLLESSLGEKNGLLQDAYQKVMEDIREKKQGDEDGEILKIIKGLIRRGEASAACRFCKVKEERVHFLNLPFYETGSIMKKELAEPDINIIKKLLKEVQPHQVFAAGDLHDPHGTHEVCLDAILRALKELKSEAWTSDCNLWLYRGAWQEWDIEKIEMAIPLSPIDVIRKRKAIFKHQSQKDYPVFPGEDTREFWQRAEDRNSTTARRYDQLGLTEYEAIEAFVKYDF